MTSIWQAVETFFTFLNDLLLKMTWLESSVEYIFKDIFGLDPSSMLFSSLTFFFYDVIKILILLSVLIFISSYIQSYFTPEKTREKLSRYKGIKAHMMGALMGTVTPFCSCSSIPIFIGFTKAGLPIGVTFSFLISSPLVDMASVILLASIFNWTVAIAYVLVGLVLAVIGGTLISIFKMDRYLAPFLKTHVKPLEMEEEAETFKTRVIYSIKQVLDVLKKVWVYIVIGVSIGALIHGVIPQAFIESILGKDNPLSVLIATIIGIPMYADIFGTLPIASSLVEKGVGLGTVLAFMMSVTALSLPSLIMLKKVVETRLLVVFIGIVTIGIILIGYVFNAFGYLII